MLPASAQGASRVSADFNGDGAADLAVGVPFEDVGGISNAGSVSVIYGSGAGLASPGNQKWTQNSDAIVDMAEEEDWFGSALAAGDFDGDGRDDLAVGAFFEDLGSLPDAGAVNVIYGSAGGLTSAGNERWTQDNPGIIDRADSGDWLGRSLAAGDLDGDGVDDLSVGVPFNEPGPGSFCVCGAVNTIYGAAGVGLDPAGNQRWTQDSPGIRDVGEENDEFGDTLATGDFNSDGIHDLAVGVDEDRGGLVDVGAVNTIYGSSPGGLTSAGNQVWTQDSPGIIDSAEAMDEFGESLTVGSFDGDAAADLAVGVPFEDLGATMDAGAVNVIYGSAGGLASPDNQRWTQDSDGIVDSAETGDRFGWAVVSGDHDGDGDDDLAVGAPSEGTTASAAGAVNAIYGSPAGLDPTGDQRWTQGSDGILDAVEDNDQFGYSLTAGDFDDDGADDLAVGVPFEEVGPPTNAGAVNAIYGALTVGLGPGGNQLWYQDSPGIAEDDEKDDEFGNTLVGDPHV
jgi:hypothetical protein